MTNDLDERLRAIASAFKYPGTPEIGRKVRARLETPVEKSRIWQVAAITISVALIVLFAVPSTRAALVGFFRVGVVRILPSAPPTFTAAPRPTVTIPSELPAALRGLSGRTTLDELDPYLFFKFKLPAYPADLGTPDYVFNQSDIPMLVFAWRDPNDAERLRLALYEIAPNSVIVSKIEPQIVQETTVNGQYALWVEGDYLLQLTNGNYDLRRTVEGYTLVWKQDGITYRLETDLSLAEARKIAESLK